MRQRDVNIYSISRGPRPVAFTTYERARTLTLQNSVVPLDGSSTAMARGGTYTLTAPRR